MAVISDVKGWVFDIQRYSIHDGPGIRTTVFFKGCPLRCLWCDNPESQKPVPEILFFESLCQRCYRCVQVCLTGATSVGKDGAIQIDRSKCTGCGKCAEQCLNEARVLSGKQMTAAEVVEVVKKDTLFYANSRGGVTASGGEPFYQPEFLKEIFRLCRELGIHTAVETSGHAKWRVIEGALPYIDLFLYDVKHLDTAKHYELTGVDNSLVLENLRKVVAAGKRVILRVPLIPGCNDQPEELEALAGLAKELGIKRLDVMAYHRLGEKKYERLGRSYQLENVAQYREDEVGVMLGVLKNQGLDVRLS
ncbi:MAG: glycyl-radical enzyme activating protein [Chloroflexota bacterium]